jgi:hypothetical protein
MTLTRGSVGTSFDSWLGLMLTFGVGIVAWVWLPTLDRSLAFICFGAGGVVAAAIFLYRWRTSTTRLADEVVAHYAAQGKKKRGKRNRRSTREAPDDRPARPFEPSSSRPLWAIFRYAGPPFWAVAIGLGANRLLATAPAAEHESVLIAREDPYKGPDVYVLRSWRPGREVERVLAFGAVQTSLSPTLPRGAHVVVTTRMGALGYEWIVSINALNEPVPE